MIEKLEDELINLKKISLSLFSSYETNNISKIGEIFIFQNGKNFKSNEYSKYSKNKLITIKNINNDSLDTSDVSYLYDDALDEKYLLNLGDVVLTMTGNVGRIAIVDEESCYLNQRVLKVNSDSKLYATCYFWKYANNLVSISRGTAQLNLSFRDLKELTARNSSKEMHTFKKFDEIFKLMLNKKRKIKKLIKIKNLLLQKYF